MADIRIKDLATTATTSASDDYLALDGSTNGTRKILATNVANNVTDVVFGASGPSAKSSIAARAARQGLVFDGTNGATVSNIAVLGANDFTFSVIITPQSFATNAYISSGNVNGFGLALLTSGLVQINFVSVIGVGTSTSALVAGKSQHIVYTRSGTTGRLYINGIQDATFTDNKNYSSATGFVGMVYDGTQRFTGTISGHTFHNRALSAAEVVSLYEAGVPAGADYNNASNTSSIISGNDSDFSGAGTWTTFNTATASVTGGKLVVSGVASGTSGVRRVPPSASIYIGRRYRLSFTISGSNGTFVVGYLGAGNTVTNISTVSGNGTFTHEFTADRSWTNFGDIVFINGGGTATAFEVDNVTMFPLGLLLAPDAAQSGGGLAWYDTSGNAANITLPATGVTWNVPTSGKAFSLSLASSTASTNTTSGALVVTGGVGVGGALNVGGAVTATGNAAVSAGLLVVNATGAAGQRYIDLGNGAGFTALRILRPSGVNGFGLQSYDSANIDLNVLGGSGGAFTISDNGTTRFTLTSAGAATFAGAVTVSSSTPSTNTTSGALVVTGGVGVGGALNVGGAMTVGGSVGTSTASTAILDYSTGARVIARGTGVGNYGVVKIAGTDSTGSAAITGGIVATFDSSNGAATFAGAVAIGNTVNTVSPTSPNRTVTMVIGGVTYYLAAKTTND